MCVSIDLRLHTPCGINKSMTINCSSQKYYDTLAALYVTVCNTFSHKVISILEPVIVLIIANVYLCTCRDIHVC